MDNKFFILICIALLTILNVFAAEVLINTQSSFDQGTYNGTSYNTSLGAVHTNLSLNLSVSTYMSPIFDAGRNATWSSLSMTFNQPTPEYLFAVDGSGAVYLSSNGGINWTRKTSDYGGGSNTKDMLSDERYVYIVFSNAKKSLYLSNNLGMSWTEVNDSISTNALQNGAADHLNNIYVSNGAGGVLMSNNSGSTWTFQGDANGGASNNPKAMAVNGSNALFLVDGDDDVYVSGNNGLNWTRQTTDYGGGSADGMTAGNTSIYILFNKQVYRSINEGKNWTIINNSFTTYGQDGLDIHISHSDRLYIVDEAERVFTSSDGGFVWTALTDFNGGAGNDVKGITSYLVETNLTYQLRGCSMSMCNDSNFTGPDGTLSSFYQGSQSFTLSSRYLQYRMIFWGQDAAATPELYNVSLQYNIIQSSSSVNLTLNGTSTNMTLTEDSLTTINGTLTGTNGTLNLTIDNIVEASSANTVWLVKNFTTNGTFAVSLFFYGDANFTASNASYFVTVLPSNQSNGTSQGSGGGSGGSGGDSGGDSGNGFNRGDTDSDDKYRSGQAPATSQGEKTSISVPAPSPTSLSQHTPTPSAPNLLTGSAVQDLDNDSGFFSNLFNAFIKPTKKEIGLGFLIAVILLLIVHIHRRFTYGEDPLYNKLKELGKSSVPAAVMQHKKAILSTFRRTYPAHKASQQRETLLQDLYQQRRERNINILKAPPAQQITKHPHKVLKTLKEVYKL